MAYGVVGTALMAFAGLLSARKKTIRRQWGRLAWWLKGHIWLGLLSVPLIVFHAAFRWGGPLEQLLWAVLAIVIVSGVVGLAFQNIFPRLMTAQLPSEAIADQLGEVCNRLQQTTDAEVLACCGEAAVTSAAGEPPPSQSPAGVDPQLELARFYVGAVRPYLADSGGDGALGNSREAQLLFERARERLPYEAGPMLDVLERRCDERRRLQLQARLHGLLHGWLRVHLPLSGALLVLVILHVLTALYY
jgi:hypothetical protein